MLANFSRLLPICIGGVMMQVGCPECRLGMLKYLGLTAIEEVDEEFLPEGEWPREPGDDSGNNSGGRAIDPTRFAFMRSLRPTMIAHFPDGDGLEYIGFVVCAPSGRYVALVERQLTQNALYAFDADCKFWGEMQLFC